MSRARAGRVSKDGDDGSTSPSFMRQLSRLDRLASVSGLDQVLPSSSIDLPGTLYPPAPLPVPCTQVLSRPSQTVGQGEGAPASHSSAAFSGAPQSVGRFLAGRLADVGVSHFFAVPGDFNLTLLSVMAQPAVRLLSAVCE